MIAGFLVTPGVPFGDVPEDTRRNDKLPLDCPPAKRAVAYGIPGQRLIRGAFVERLHLRTPDGAQDGPPAARARMRGGREDRRAVGAPANLPDVRDHALLRPVAEPSRQEAREGLFASRCRVGRIRREVAVLLRG